jgi:hypothetical protein
MAVNVLLVIAIGLFIGLVVIPHLHFIAVAIAHIFHPHVLGIVAAVAAVTLLLLAFFWPARVMAPAQAIVMRAEPGHAVMEVRDAPRATKTRANVAGEFQSTPTWAKLVPVTVILLGIAVAVALIANPHFRAFLQSRPAAIILAACAIVFMMFLFAVRVSYQPAAMSSGSANGPNLALSPATMRTPARPPTERESTQSKAEPPTNANPVTLEKAEDVASLPDWVHREPARTDDPYYVVVSSGDFTDAFARDEMLSAQMVNAADRYIREVLRRPAVADAIKFDPAYLRSAYFDAQYPPPGSTAAGEETFVRLKFDSHFRDEVDRRWQDFVSSEHLEKLSGYSAVGLALLGVVYIYLRATSPKPAS